jgi:hypothetical protein
MYIDQDEYVFSTRTTLKHMLNSVGEDVTDIFMPWRIYGSSGLVKQPDSIRQSFVHMEPFDKSRHRAISHGNIRGHGKSITRVSSLTMLNIHQCARLRYATLTPDGVVVHSKDELKEWFKTFTPNSKTDIVSCNHYMTMSREYCEKCKCTRPSGACNNNVAINFDKYWNRLDHTTSQDTMDTSILLATKAICVD